MNQELKCISWNEFLDFNDSRLIISKILTTPLYGLLSVGSAVLQGSYKPHWERARHASTLVQLLAQGWWEECEIWTVCVQLRYFRNYHFWMFSGILCMQVQICMGSNSPCQVYSIIAQTVSWFFAYLPSRYRGSLASQDTPVGKQVWRHLRCATI